MAFDTGFSRLAALRPAGAGVQAASDSLHDPTAAGLRSRAASDPKSVIKAAAKQFEAMFMQQLMKSMRESTMASGMLDNAGTQMGTEMLDAQFANQMTGLPGGLADVIARQLDRQMSGVAGNGAAAISSATTSAPSGAIPAAGAAGAPASRTGGAQATPNQAEFLRQHDASARAAEAQTGIPAAFMVAQAAHESGWGRREIRNTDGSTSFNVFGIKAGAGWKGRVAQVTTTEVVDGQPRKVLANFRAYRSYEESFCDYAQMMKANPRYATVASAGNSASGFAQGLQRAGYATDPAYADKLTRVINTTLRLQRAVVRPAENLA